MIFRPGDMVRWLDSSFPMVCQLYNDARLQTLLNRQTALTREDRARARGMSLPAAKRSDVYVVLAVDDLVMTALRNVDSCIVYFPSSWTNSLQRV